MEKDIKAIKFMDPREVLPPKGVEGWERMYPPGCTFTPKGEDPERARYESERMWIWDSLHERPIPWPFFTDWFDFMWWAPLSQMNTNVWCLPPAFGIDHRMLYGHPFITSIPNTDPKLIEERAKIFQRRVGYYFENWDYAVNNAKIKQNQIAKAQREISFQELPNVAAEADVISFRGTYGYLEMEMKWKRMMDLWKESVEYHFELFNIAHYAHGALSEFAKINFPDIKDDTVAKFILGVGSDVYRPDEEVQKLALQAMGLGVGEAILQPGNFSEVESRLKKTEVGRSWLQSLEMKKDPWFYFTTGASMPSPYDKFWIDDMDVPLKLLRQYLGMLKEGKRIFRDSVGQTAESDRIFNEYKGLLKEEARPQFDQLRALDRKTSPHIEGHMFWCENLSNHNAERVLRELGTIFENCGLLKEPMDIWYLRYGEIEDMIRDYVRFKTTNPFVGKPSSAYFWNKEIKWRKEVCQRLAEWSPPPILGIAPAEIQDPNYIGLWGITSERIALWHSAEKVRPGEVSEMSGFSASSGVAEGVARVLTDVSKIEEVERGEILVCKTTAPSWGPVFSRAKAVVADLGGIMSHSAIVAREYGIPAVTGTFNSTMVVKTGDVIKVDGDNGVVTIIKRAK